MASPSEATNQSPSSEAKRYGLKDKLMLKPQIESLQTVGYALGITLFTLTLLEISLLKEMSEMKKELKQLREEIELRRL